MSKIILLCWLVLPLCSSAQLSPEQALKTLDDKYPQEKLHIFMDREEYAAGETIWFKAYLFSGYVKSLISSTVYADLLTAKGELVQRVTVPMWYAVGNGSIEIPASLHEGVYHIRAYTKWMLNFDPAFQYYTTVLVYNASSAKKISRSSVKWTANAFPESGRLLAGVENKVAIRLNALGSLPSSWSGTLVNTARPGQPLLQFSSLTPDVAAFLFTPEANNMYEVHIKDSFGNFSSIALSPATSGVSLRAEQSGKEVYVDMIFKGLPDAGLNHRLVVHMQQQLVLNSIIRKKQEVVKTSIPADKLMTGILHLTLFDPLGKPVAERLVFVDNEYGKNGEAGTRVLNELDGKKPVHIASDSADFFNYALSVTGDAVSADRRRTIYSDLWLGDLSRMPENGSVYFTGKPEDVLATDALLITEKWNRFQWEEILNNRFPVIRDSAERHFSYRATATRNKKGVANELITLMLRFKDSSVQFLQVRTNSFGEFHLDDIVFYDSVKVYYQQAKGQRTNDVQIIFERKNVTFTQQPLRLPATSFVLTDRLTSDTVTQIVMNAKEQLQAEKLAESQYSQMEEVKVSAERKTKKELLNQELASPLFQTQNEQVFDILNDEPSIQSYANIFDWLDGRVAGLQFKIMNEDEVGLFNLELIGQRQPMMRDQSVSLFIDEMPTDLAAVYALPTSEIAMVKVIKGYFLGASSGGAGGGAIAIYTKKAGLSRDRNSLPSGVMVGYSPVKNFSNNSGNSRQNLVQWSPVILPDKGGSITINPPEVSTPYRITVTGFTGSAQPFYKVYYYPGK